MAEKVIQKTAAAAAISADTGSNPQKMQTIKKAHAGNSEKTAKGARRWLIHGT